MAEASPSAVVSESLNGTETQEAQKARAAAGPDSGLSVVGQVAQGLAVVSSVGAVANDSGSRFGDALRSLWDGFTSAVVGVGRNLLEAGSDLARGAAQLISGEVAAGGASLARGGLKLLQTPIDATLMLFGKGVSAAQTLTHVEAPGRRLGADELQRARSVFGDSIDYSRVQIKEGDAGAFSLNDRPFALGDTIYMTSTNDDGTLIHELTHVWQHQNGGTDYMSEALTSQLTSGTYDWRQEVPHTPWADLSPEKQGAFLEDAYRRRAFSTEPPAYPKGTQAPNNSSLSDLNLYLQSAMREVRAGRGAT
ncbi:MAG: hypothetical protein RJA70_2041 [Pseudomonadota bacterium]|jgi:hypothetical protein